MDFAYAKVLENEECQKITLNKGSSQTTIASWSIRDLSEEEAQIANNARVAALDIVKDALKKSMYGKPVTFHYTCAELEDPYEFCAIPTKEFLEALVEKLEKITFKFNPELPRTFAYVTASDIKEGKSTVYLCPVFWRISPTLMKDSQPGTLIHEVSHLLGTQDIAYELLKIKGDIMNGIFAGRSVFLEKSKQRHVENQMININANSLEYEYELILNHEGEWDAANGRYLCCGETKLHSLCRNRSTGHYSLHELVVH